MREKFNYYPWQVRKFLLNEIPKWENEELLNGITQSSLEVEPGDVFVALKGKRDGHEFIPEAFDKGAKLVIAEKNHPILNKLNQNVLSKIIQVKDTRRALGELARKHRERFYPIVIAVTGSSGKTTTKEIISNVRYIIGEEKVVFSQKNFNNEIGVPFTLFQINEKTQWVVLELAMNHKGEIKRLSQMAKPDVAIITTLGEAHIEFLGSEKNIALAKAEILQGMAKKSHFYISQNCPRKKIPIKIAKKKGIFVHEIKRPFQILKTEAKGFLLSYKGEQFFWPLLGETILNNLSLAISVLEDLGISSSDLVKALSYFKGAEHRLKIWDREYLIIDDTYNSNPTALKAAVEAALQLAQGKPCYAILGDFKELGKFSAKYHKKIGLYLAKSKIQDILTFGEDSFILGKAFSKKRKNTFWEHFANSEEAIEKIFGKVKENISKDSVILVKGSRSLAMERIVQKLIAHP